MVFTKHFIHTRAWTDRLIVEALWESLQSVKLNSKKIQCWSYKEGRMLFIIFYDAGEEAISPVIATDI